MMKDPGNTSSRRRRVVVLISGRGSNMAALVDAAGRPGYPAEIVGVVADNPEAGGLAMAHRRNIPGSVVDRRSLSDKAAFEAALFEKIAGFQADLVCLAGFMRVLSPAFVERLKSRILNIHPSLLPAFRGLETHARVLKAGVCLTGCTVHVVSAELDAGPIIAQAAVPVSPDDNEERLAARVLSAEHKLYPHALALFSTGAVIVEGDRAVFADTQTHDQSGMLMVPAA